VKADKFSSVVVIVGLIALSGCAHDASRSNRQDTAAAVIPPVDQDARASSLLQAAELAKASGDRPAATQLYTEAVNAQPANAAAWCSLGTNYLDQNEVDLAVAALQEAVRRDPSLQKAWSNLALAHVEQFRIAARNALSGKQLSEANRDALTSLLADADRTVGAEAPVPPAAPAKVTPPARVHSQAHVSSQAQASQAQASPAQASQAKVASTAAAQ
jgi:cytochrome c-type biogenesis protein CcmH/NrfG